MTAHEYLMQVYYYNRKIKYDLACLDELRAFSYSISSPQFGERVEGSKSTDPPFVRALEKIFDKEAEINAEIAKLNSLKEEIQGVIEQLPNVDERFVLLYRYIHNMTWEDISLELHLSVSSVRRLCSRGLKNIVVPE